MASPPNSTSTTLALYKTRNKSKSSVQTLTKMSKDDGFYWFERPFGLDQQLANIIFLGLYHTGALYYCYIYFITKEVNPRSIIFELFYSLLGTLATNLGCHRYWTHKTFKANLPLQILMMVMQTITLQYPIYKWCLDHRIHHKYTDTDADPHNSKRGFWYSHIGWLLLPKTKELKEKLKTFDMPDLINDPVVRFQSRRYYTIAAVFHFLIPISVYHYVFEMPLFYCFLANCRGLIINAHVTFCVNSFAHLWGDKPYDKNISPVENKIVTVLTAGEAWHNYHHTFPWDYRTSEFGWRLNLSTMLIDFFAWIGWAWDLKTVSETMIHDRIKRTGDGSRVVPEGGKRCIENICERLNTQELKRKTNVWGWDDENITDELRKITNIIKPK